IVRKLMISGDDLSESDFSWPTDDLLEELRLCLTLVAPCAIVAARQQSLFEDPDFADLAELGGFSWRAMDVRPMHLVSFGVFDTERAQRLVRAYLALDAGARGRIHLALDRFDRALRRHMPGDAATELAISLDSLLGDGEGELTWKVSLRSALSSRVRNWSVSNEEPLSRPSIGYAAKSCIRVAHRPASKRGGAASSVRQN